MGFLLVQQKLVRVDATLYIVPHGTHTKPPNTTLSRWIPGAVLGGLAGLGFLCFTVWLFTLCCRRHHWQHELETLPASWSADDNKRMYVLVCQEWGHD